MNDSGLIQVVRNLNSTLHINNKPKQGSLLEKYDKAYRMKLNGSGIPLP